jgi:hypothetical protein
MPGVAETDFEIRSELMPHAIRARLQPLHDTDNVRFFIQRPQRRVRRSQSAAEILRVFFLNTDRIVQHHIGDIRRRRRAENRPAKTGLVQARQVADVIGVGMRENHAIEVFRPTKKLLVLLSRFRTMPLEKTAIQQDATVAGLNEMLTAGDFPRRTQKRQFHANPES